MSLEEDKEAVRREAERQAQAQLDKAKVCIQNSASQKPKFHVISGDESSCVGPGCPSPWRLHILHAASLDLTRLQDSLLSFSVTKSSMRE